MNITLVDNLDIKIIKKIRSVFYFNGRTQTKREKNKIKYGDIDVRHAMLPLFSDMRLISSLVRGGFSVYKLSKYTDLL